MGRSTRRTSLDASKASYRNARENGDKEEEAKWANQIGHAYKDRGEYVNALKWFRHDYEICSRNSSSDPSKLMPSCQSMGEVYLRLQNYDEALIYQGKHFHLAEQAGDVVEQQRASTQLGRTYLELYEVKDRTSGLLDARTYFQTSLDLARRLRTNPPENVSSLSGFVVEEVDAYNNLGLERVLADDHQKAFKFCYRGLKLCDEEEVDENDAARSRLHHNLGRVYADIRDFDKAKFHTEKDIQICQQIPHAQGEAKGLMNLAGLYFKSQDYEQATSCYRRALHIAQGLEDEDAMCAQIKGNIEVVEQAKAKSKTLDEDIKKLSKIRRNLHASKGTAVERTFLKQEYALLMEVAGLAEELQAWNVHLGHAKRLKNLTKQLGDNERLGDAYVIVGDSYYNLRSFHKAKKWHQKSFHLCKRIGHLEGQVVAKINYGNALDAAGEREAALKAYQEAYELSSAGKSSGSGKMLEQQISALNNMHYSYLVRMEKLDEAMKVDMKLKELKHESDMPKSPAGNDSDERCSETGSEGPDEERSPRPRAFVQQSQRSKRVILSDEDECEGDDGDAPEPLSQSATCRKRPRGENNYKNIRWQPIQSLPEQPNCLSPFATDDNYARDSDDDEGMLEMSSKRYAKRAARGAAVAVEDSDSESDCLLSELLEKGPKRRIRPPTSKDVAREFVNVSSDDDWLRSPPASKKRKGELKRPSRRSSSSSRFAKSPSNESDDGPFAFDNASGFAPDIQVVQSPAAQESLGRVSNIEVPLQAVQLQAAQSSKDISRVPTPPFSESEKVPTSARGTSSGGACNSRSRNSRSMDEELDERVDTVVSGTSPIEKGERLLPTGHNALLECYMNRCAAASSSISPNKLLVERLQNQKVSEEVIVAGCNIEDCDAKPLLAALVESDAFSMLDMSHNSLGNATVHAIQELIKSTNQMDLGLTLDLHRNKLGAGALLQICHCPVSLSRIEILNLSGNRLTDAAGRHLSRILKESQALATLNLDSCALSTRSIKQLAGALSAESSLTKLCIGRNNPIAGFAIEELLQKLTLVTSFSELDLTGVELDEVGVAGVVTLLQKSTSISSLILQRTNIQNDGALALADALELSSPRLTKMDLSLNGLHTEATAKLCSRLMSIRSLSSLNLSDNVLEHKTAEVLAEGLAQTTSRLKVLDLSKCHLGQSDVLVILQSLKDQTSVLELNLASNLLGLDKDPPLAEEKSIDNPRAGGFIKGQAASRLSHGILETIQVDDYYKDGRCDLVSQSDKISADSHPVAPPPGSQIGSPTRQAQSAKGENDNNSSGRHTKADTGETLCDVRVELQLDEQQPVVHPAAVSHAETVSRSRFPEDQMPASMPSDAAQLREGVVDSAVEGSQMPNCNPSQLQVEQTNGDFTNWGRDEVLELQSSVDLKQSNSNCNPSQLHVVQLEGDCKDPVQDMVLELQSSVNLKQLNRTAEAGNEGATGMTAAAKASRAKFVQELATSIGEARGLRKLDLSQNNLEKDDIDLLYLQSWCACPRHDDEHLHRHHQPHDFQHNQHQQHFDGSRGIVHFYMGGRCCSCSRTPCCDVAH